jgi:hypothetical protein
MALLNGNQMTKPYHINTCGKYRFRRQSVRILRQPSMEFLRDRPYRRARKKA